MITDIFYPLLTLTIINLACFIRKKKLFGGFAPTPSSRHHPGYPGWLTAPPRPQLQSTQTPSCSCNSDPQLPPDPSCNCQKPMRPYFFLYYSL